MTKTRDTIKRVMGDVKFHVSPELAAQLSALDAADAQALADVRTLDEYVEKLGRGFGWTVSVYRGGVYGVVFTNDNWEEQQGVPCLEGATPVEARAKAAAWVREQAKGAL